MAGDFRGDGRIGLAVGNRTDNTVTVLLGQAGGALGGRVDYSVGPGPSGRISGGGYRTSENTGQAGG